MARGKASEAGDTRVSSNGYHYTRTVKEWRLTHHIMAEQLLGRPLADNERVRFKDGNRYNLEADNIEVYKKGSSSIARTRAQLLARRDEIDAQLASLDCD
jgi:hypothetical protein